MKRGDRAALRLLGYGRTVAVKLERVRFTPAHVPIGGRVAMTFALRNTSRTRQDLLVDVAVHFVKARGHSSRKVFKVRRITLAPRARSDLTTSFSLAVHTTRVPRPGRHAVELLINGAVFPAGAFRVTPRA